jgi:hypothetical protein
MFRNMESAQFYSTKHEYDLFKTKINVFSFRAQLFYTSKKGIHMDI